MEYSGCQPGGLGFWTLADRRVRDIIPVGGAYGSDVPLVIETLLKCADAHTKV